jgi:drug/metabolite transporter (DMT)-like permease
VHPGTRAAQHGSAPAASGTRARPWSAGLGAGALGVLCFSGTAPATRVAEPAFGAVTVTAARIVIAAILGLGLLSRTGGRRWPARTHLRTTIVMGSGLAVGYPLFLALAVRSVPAYHAAVVIGLTPAVTAVAAVIRTGERPRPRFWIGCLIGLATIVAFAIHQDAGLVPGDGWLAAAVLSCAIGYVEGGRLSEEVGAITALCWAVITLAPAAAIALAIAPAVQPAIHLHATAWISLAYVGLASMFLGSIAWYRGLATGGIARVGQLNLLQPFLALAWSALLLGEDIPLTAYAATAIVTCCLALCITSGVTAA